MSNYTQTTFFTPKDSLPSTDPNKTIFGAQYDTEFGAIATAIATKYDSSTVLFPQIKTSILSSSVTSRTSTTTLTNDANLQYAITAAGTYKVDVIFVSQTIGAGGIAFNLNYGGTIGNSGNAIVSPAMSTNAVNTSLSINGGALLSNAVNVASFAFAPGGAYSATFSLSTLFVATTAGTIALAWAQNASNGTVVNVNQGSSMLVTRVA